MPSTTRTTAAVENIRRTRARTQSYLEDLTTDEWFWCPSELTTHIAWQVGHLAVSQYNLCMRRLRGRIPEDEKLISDSFIEVFKLGSTPLADPAGNPPLEEIRSVFAAVQNHAIAELSALTDDELNVPVEQPHPVFKTKLEAVEYSWPHELVHIGQIALLRRLMGKRPLR